MANGSSIRVLVVENTQMSCDLLVGVLGRSRRFSVSGIAGASGASEMSPRNQPDVALISSLLDLDPRGGIKLTQKLCASHPKPKVVIMLDAPRREEIIDAFRAGAVGIFCRNETTKSLSKCVGVVYGGQVWADNSQLKFALEALAESPKLRIVNSAGKALLSDRQMQIVRYVADGLTNREIGKALNLSEHTVKNYLYRIFDRLGVSTRVELVLYAFSHLAPEHPHCVNPICREAKAIQARLQDTRG